MSAAWTSPWDDPRIFRGMTAQLKRRRELLDGGQEPLGWKLAFGAPAAMERLRISAPLVGFLMRSALLPSNATLSVDGWAKPAAEPEIAVHLGKELASHSNRDTVMAAIAGLGPTIEIADVDRPSDDVEGTLACNIYQRHIILGPNDVSRRGGQLNGLSARVLRNGAEIANITAPETLQALTGELIEIVRHTANLLAAFHETLQAGQIVIAGSITPPIWVEPGEEIVFQLSPFDPISIRFSRNLSR